MDEPKVRYSDADLQEFKEVILAKLEKANKEFEELRGYVVNNSDNTDSDTAHSFMKYEEASDTLGKELSEQLAQRQLTLIKKLQAALVRIENKTYGICRETGQLIPKGRLLAVPHATLTMEAKQKK